MKKLITVILIMVSLIVASFAVRAADGDEYITRRQEMLCATADMSLNSGASRTYSHKPLAMLYLEKDVDEANRILCSSYIKDTDFDNDTYELYWAMPALTTLYYMFNTTSPTEKPLLTAEGEAVVVRKLYEFLKRETVGQIDEDINPLRAPASENHNMIMKATTYLISQKLSEYDEYKDQVMPCGDTVSEYYSKALIYLKNHFDFIIKNAVTVEGGDTYVAVTLENVYNLYAFSKDEALRKQAKTYLDLYWIKYASESIDLIKAGAKARCYSDWAKSGSGRLYALAAVYFGDTVYKKIQPLITPLVVNYHPPRAAYEILEKKDSLAPYEYIERNMGAGYHKVEVVANEEWPVYYYDANDTISRYSYVTPDFILGSFLRNPQKSYMLITSQNQYEGAVLKNDKRIYTYIDRTDANLHNSFLTMQKGEVMITKKTGSFSGGVGLYISDVAEKDMTSEGGWYFYELESAYLAVKAAEGGFSWTNGKFILDKERDIFIIRLARKSDYTGYAAFRSEIVKNSVAYSGGVLKYTDKKWGEFTFSPDSRSDIRLLDGKCYDENFEYTVKSPFSEQKFKQNSFRVKLDNEYVWNLSSYTVSPSQGAEGSAVTDVKIYGIPEPGNTLTAVAAAEGTVLYEWYLENQADGGYEYLSGGVGNELYIDEAYENLNIKVRCRTFSENLFMGDYKESIPIKIRSERSYVVKEDDWAKSGISEEISGNGKSVTDAGSVSMTGGDSGYVKVRKSFSPIKTATVVEFTARNSGGGANVAYINGSGGTAVNINVSGAGTYNATVGDGNGSLAGYTLKSDTSDNQAVRFKVIITPGGTKSGYVSIFADGIPKVLSKPLRNEVSDVCNMFFQKSAGSGTLVIEDMNIYSLSESEKTELFAYDGGVCVISEKSRPGCAVVKAYYKDDYLLSATLFEGALSEGINYFEKDTVKTGADMVKTFLFDDIKTLVPLAEK